MVVGAERQSALMSKITNDDLTRSGTEDSMSLIPKWQQWSQRVESVVGWYRMLSKMFVCLVCHTSLFRKTAKDIVEIVPLLVAPAF